MRKLPSCGKKKLKHISLESPHFLDRRRGNKRLTQNCDRPKLNLSDDLAAASPNYHLIKVSS
ncbi:MAG: hypothetical protein HC903_08080 [Methylacidiphilales bacterium]|nr:hypothetical protein [Candidatus Methylacidiphilales bacterium]NJR15875.1 hypothetical protein [Calothrix sp. CSU_2_0]